MIGDLFKQMKETQEENRTVLPFLIETLRQTNEIDPPGPTSWMGFSAMPSWCPRQHVMAYRMKLKLVREFDAQARWRMDRGTAMHLIVQELWLGPAKVLMGGWQCPECNHLHGIDPDSPEKEVTMRSAIVVPDVCEACNKKRGRWRRFRFVEPGVRDRELLLIGKSDGILAMPANPRKPFDLKVVADLSAVRHKPKADDVSQLHWYMNSHDHRTGLLMYFDPGAKTIGASFVEHEIAFDPALLHREKEKIRGLRQALEDETRPVPPCPYDGEGAYGPCGCIEMARFWTHRGSRPWAKGDRNGHPF